MSDIEILLLLTTLIIVAVIPRFWSYFIPTHQETVLVEGEKKQRVHSDNSQRYEFYSFIRGIAMVGIILIHVSYFYVYVGDFAITFNTVLNNFSRFALPIFFISSGILLTQPRWTKQWLVKFYSDRFFVVVIPYLLVTWFLVVVHERSTSEFIYHALTGTASLPFYFVLVLLQLYVLYPIIFSLAHKRWFIFLSLLVSIGVYLSGIGRMVGEIYTFLPFLFFFVWGIYMREYFLYSKKYFVWWPWILIIFLFVGLQVVFGVDFFFNGQYFYGIAVLLLFFNLYYTEKIPAIITSIFSWIGDRSLWVFLLHFPIMEGLFWYFSTYPVFAGQWGEYILFMYLSIVLSIGIAGLCTYLQKRGVKWLFG